MARRAVAKLFDWQKLNSPNGKNWYMIQGRPTGKRERFYFETETEAKKAVADRNRQIAAFGSQNTLSDCDRVMAAECIKMLAPLGKTLYQATHFYRDYLEKTTTSITVDELCDRVAAEFDRRLKDNEFRSNRHHISMNETIRKFRAKFGDVPIKTLKGTTIKAWLALEPLAVKTRNRHLSYIGNIFGIAREWELMDTDPFEKVESFNDPAKNGRKIGILTPEEFTKFLTVLDPDWLPFFAISGFTGLRRSEIEKLDWSEIKLDRSLIDLPFHKSKNGNRKLIEVPENLATILSPFIKAEGPIIPRKKLQFAKTKATRASDITWKQNCLRHSFCSYAVAVKGLDWTAIQADHDTKMLKKHYLEVVTKEDAANYWAIRPDDS
jgi:integrase